jgi:hypothetical protein
MDHEQAYASIAGELTVWGNVDDWLNILSSGNEGTGNDRVVGLAEDTDGTEQVLSGSL